MRQKHHRAILQALCYSDIFDYPLTARQVWDFMNIRITLKQLLASLKEFPYVPVKGQAYYFLKGRQAIVNQRIKKKRISEDKIKKAKAICHLLAFIPTILFIGISGSVAMCNADRSSDIDLFFITSSHSLWITRFLVYIFLDLLGLKRKKGKNNSSNKFCANMFVSYNHLGLPTYKRNLYSAHEITQVLPIIDKQQTYTAFLQANKWILTYFPNMTLLRRRGRIKNMSLFFLIPIEIFLKKIQLWYMKNYQTNEITTASLIAFHPIQYEDIILDTYEKRVKQYAL